MVSWEAGEEGPLGIRMRPRKGCEDEFQFVKSKLIMAHPCSLLPLSCLSFINKDLN